MKVEYNVEVPLDNRKRSEEWHLINEFCLSNNQNVSLTYDTKEEAKSKLSAIKSLSCVRDHNLKIINRNNQIIVIKPGLTLVEDIKRGIVEENGNQVYNKLYDIYDLDSCRAEDVYHDLIQNFRMTNSELNILKTAWERIQENERALEMYF